MKEPKTKSLKLIILDILRKSELHGYGISEKIDEIYGVGKPSSGIIYPTLSSLKKSGLIRIYAEGERDKKIYSITPKGIEYLKENKENLEKAKTMLKNLGEFYSMGGKKLVKDIEKLIKNMHEIGEEEKKRIAKIINRMHEEIEEIGMGENE